jgi:two-component system OmpR family response regulator
MVGSIVARRPPQCSDLPHVLIVDDDGQIRALLRNFILKNGFQTTAVANGAAMRRTLEQTNIDLIILDLMLPGEDGFSLCRSLRANSQIPVLMLTAHADDADRIAGFDAGADDFLAKPFHPGELIARIKAVLRRTQIQRKSATACRYRFGNWQFDTATRQLTHKDGRAVNLSGAEFSLLNELLAHPSQVVSRAHLAKTLLGRDLEPFDRILDMRISRLRHVLRDDAGSPEIVRTVYGAGYVVDVSVQRLS